MHKCILIITMMAAVIGISACAGAKPREAESSNKGSIEAPLTMETEAPLPMIYVQGQLYRLFSEQREPMGDSGSVTGHIQSSVETDETPMEEEQSNFGGVGKPYCLDKDHGQLVAMINDEWQRFTAVNLEVTPVDVDRLSKPMDLLGADGMELNYIGKDIIVFHSFAGVFVCKFTEDGWVLSQTLDLEPLEGTATQGDNFTLIRADGQAVWISPKCYAPDNEIPVTYKYLIAENRLELAGRFQEEEDDYLRWSYSEEGMALKETVRSKLEQEGMVISNLYPVLYMDSEVYGFIAVDSGERSSIQYGRYWKASGEVKLETISVKMSGN